jgi:hypothetical protein
MTEDGHIPRACRRLIRAAGRLVPGPRREEWLREWEAELWYWRRSHPGPEWDAEALRRCWGAFADAYWLSDFRETARGPACCLAVAALALAAAALASGGFAVTRSRIAPLPYDDPDRIVTISQRALLFGRPTGASTEQMAAWRHHFSGLAAYRWGPDASRASVSADFFTVLGVRARHGRTFEPGDSDAVVLSYRFWRERFGGDAGIVGREAVIDTRKVRVAGVLPPDFWFLSKGTEVWSLLGTGRGRFGLVARLAPGSTAERVEEALQEVRHPRKFNRNPSLHSMIDSWARGTPEVSALQARVRQPLYTCGFGSLLAMAIALAAAARWRRSPRYALFFLGKAWPALAAVGLSVIEFTRAASLSMLGGGESLAEPFGAWWSLTASACLLYWAFVDQRKRCRRCLSKLTRGVRVGRPAAILFDYSGEELVCGCGHGALYIPEVKGQESDRWAALDESWQGLFGGGTRR